MSGRVIIVTGASRGLGREIALRFGRAGDRVAVNYRGSAREAEAVAEAIIASGGEAIALRADIRESDAVNAMASDVIKRWGGVDVLVNNAGAARDGLAVRMTEGDWDDVLDTNLRGPFLCIRAVSGIMTEKRRGHIVNIGSITGIQGREGQANYAASKAGLIGLTSAAARELGGFNIKVNAVLPGYLGTDMGKSAPDAALEKIVRANVLGRTSDTAEVAEFIFNLTLMKNVSGQVFNLDSRII